MIRVICVYIPQVGRSECKKDQFYNDMAGEWDLQNPGKVVLGLGDFNRHVGRWIDGFGGVHGGYKIGKRNVEERRLLKFCDEKESCKANTCLKGRSRGKYHRVWVEMKQIDFILVSKNNKKFKRCDSHPLGVATSASGNRHRQKKDEESSEDRTNY